MKYMKQNGFEVTMMSADGSEINELISTEGCPHIIIPLTRKITPLKDLKALWSLYKHLKKIKPDIIHSHTPKAGIIAMISSWLARVPIRIHTVAGLPLQTTSGLKRQILILVEKLTYFFATNVWPNSQSLIQFITEEKFCSKNKISIVGQGSSNGIDINEFNETSLDVNKLKEIKQKINFDEKNFYLLFVGRVVKDKGIIELVETFKRLQQQFDGIRLIIVGKLEQDLDPLPIDTLKEIRNNKSIFEVGFSYYVKYYMNLSDLFVFPSHREGFPNVPMQAGLMNCPVIASRITGNIDIIDHKINGLLFEKGNVDELEKCILELKSNTEKANKFRQALSQKITNDFSRKSVQKTILNKYHSLLNQEE